jgi:hypothetical protein
MKVLFLGDYSPATVNNVLVPHCTLAATKPGSSRTSARKYSSVIMAPIVNSGGVARFSFARVATANE